LKQSTTPRALEQYLTDRLPALNLQYGKPIQTPMVIPEPGCKYDRPLLLSCATDADIKKIRIQACKAGVEEHLEEAKVLWRQVIKADRSTQSDRETAIDEIARIDKKIKDKEIAAYKQQLAEEERKKAAERQRELERQQELERQRQEQLKQEAAAKQQREYSKALGDAAHLYVERVFNDLLTRLTKSQDDVTNTQDINLEGTWCGIVNGLEQVIKIRQKGTVVYLEGVAGNYSEETGYVFIGEGGIIYGTLVFFWRIRDAKGINVMSILADGHILDGKYFTSTGGTGREIYYRAVIGS